MIYDVARSDLWMTKMSVAFLKISGRKLPAVNGFLFNYICQRLFHFCVILVPHHHGQARKRYIYFFWNFLFYFPLYTTFPFWLLIQSAKAIRKLSEVLGESLSPSHHDLIQCLLKEVPGRLWEVCLYCSE